MTYFFETYGCQMNKAESASLEQLLLVRGWTASEYAETADLVIINTCSVRATAETRIHGRLGWYSALKKERNGIQPASNHREARPCEVPVKKLTLVVTGCMAERLKDSLKRDFPVVDYVVGTFKKQHFQDIIDAVEQDRELVNLEEDAVYSFAPLSYEPGAFQAFVPIMHGCNNFCSYCIVPYVRGREISRPADEILKEIDMLSAKNVKEVTLLGQNVNSYRFEETLPDGTVHLVDFPELLERIAVHIRETKSSIGWVRFMSSHPKDLSDRLIDIIAKERVLCRHIHLPVQNGSTAVLKAMNRKYTREQYLELVDKIRKRIPDVSLSTDILVGFPGETEEYFEQTVSLMQQVRYEAAYMYYYNPREGTVAFSMKNQIPMEEKKRRVARIIEVQLGITKEQLEQRIGEKVLVLVEAESRGDSSELLGRTERDERVVFKGDKSLIGSFVNVSLDELNGNTFRGKLIDTDEKQ
ncbi:MAG: tRNA (N6-isopentenyl adenosine(37)-C2)-methylthiotransferase MiaB [Spirochaetaceae bacterium]|nr:tRNA (N6-isopentenyl adenosine(37)-C2)-methylthiotransferase MiaB [Spirochaetaceae bacterium]